MEFTGAVDEAATIANREMLALRDRGLETTLALKLAATAMYPTARSYLEKRIDAETPLLSAPAATRELIVGGGLHAAIYAAGRVAAGHEKPLVVERFRLGGAFAMSSSASFWTNSRNRPGLGGFPSENRALNYVPGAPVQIADVSGLEFADNADWAFVIRATLASHANVLQGEVARVESVKDAYRVTLADDRVVHASRVVDARGLGDHRSGLGQVLPSTRILTFKEMVGRMDLPFPLQGMKRVAIVGDGNSALCAAEMLLGISPRAGMSVASLDWVEQVDLYGPSFATECEEWRSQQRGRYQALGSFLKPLDNGIQRLRVRQQRGRVVPSIDSVLVNGRTYDHAIVATGWQLPDGLFELEPRTEVGDVPVRALRVGEVYRVGPAANLPFQVFEQTASGGVSRIQENKVALFRLGPRTAALATELPGVEVPEVPKSASKPASAGVEFDPVGREFLTNDRNGNPIYVGDRIRYRKGGYAAEGPAIMMVADGLKFEATGIEGFAIPNGLGLLNREVKYIEKIEQEPEKIEPKFLANDRNGNPIFEGDRVRYVSQEGLYVFEGRAVDIGSTKNYVKFQRDADESGNTPALLSRQVRYLTNLDAKEKPKEKPEDKPPAPAAGVDRNGTTLYVGDRVRDSGNDPFTATVIGRRDGYTDVKRDDGITGGETDGYTVGAYSIEKIKEEPSAVREKLAVDKNGNPIFEGDRVRYFGNILGTVAGVEEGVLLLVRDDGLTGSGPNGEYRVGTTVPRTVSIEKVEEEPETRKKLAGDENGKPIFEGDKVRYYGAPGTVVGVDRDSLLVVRDDGAVGSGPNGEYRSGILANRMVAIEKIEGEPETREEPETPTAEEKPETRKKLAGDKDGNPLYVGDRVTWDKDGPLEFDATLTGVSDGLLLAVRDDGVRGGGPNGEYQLTRAQARSRNVTKLYPEATPEAKPEEKPEKKEKLGGDKDGKPLFKGDRVKYLGTYLGTVADLYNGLFVIRRDDGLRGMGPDGGFRLGKAKDKMNDLKKLEFLVNDKDGNPIFEGDKVGSTAYLNDLKGTATKPSVANRGTYSLYIMRDDGIRNGSGENGEWALTAEQVRDTVTKINE